MSVLLRFASLVLVGGLVLASCTGSGAPGTPASAASGAQAAPSAGDATIGSISTKFGIVLTGPGGKTLYIHAGDGPSTSTCTGGCATAWPPLAVRVGQQPSAGPGVTGKLGTFTRADGSSQVSYDGLPLYYWQGDTKPGDVTGQGVASFSVATAGGAAPAPGGAPSPSAKGGYGY